MEGIVVSAAKTIVIMHRRLYLYPQICGSANTADKKHGCCGWVIVSGSNSPVRSRRPQEFESESEEPLLEPPDGPRSRQE